MTPTLSATTMKKAWTTLALALTLAFTVGQGAWAGEAALSKVKRTASSAEEGAGRRGELVETTLIQPDGTYARIQYERIDGEAVFEGDILLNIDEEGYARFGPLPEEESRWGPMTKSAGRSGPSKFWPGHTVYYSIESGMANTYRITDAIDHWEKMTNLQFIEDSSAPNRIYFKTHSSSCSSSVGMQGGVQNVNLATSCTTGNTKHEIGHAIGLYHEQTRADRDNYMTINWANIKSSKTSNFEQYSSGADYGDIDPGSIMMYSCTAFSRNGDNTIDPFDSTWCDEMGQRDGLSDGDVDGVTAMYPTSQYAAFDAPTSNTAKKMTASASLGIVGVSSATAIDMDGDGVDEIALLIGGMQLLVFENDGETVVGSDPINFSGASEIVGGDFDGDGDEELLALKSGKAYVYDPPSLAMQPWTLSATWMVPNLPPVGDVSAEFAAVDYDGDLTDELVMLYGGLLFILEAGPSGLSMVALSPTVISSTDMSGVDNDGDGFDELLVSKENSYVYIYEFGTHFELTEVASDLWGMPALTGSTLLVAGYDDDGTSKIATVKY